MINEADKVHLVLSDSHQQGTLWIKTFGSEFSLFKHEFVGLAVHISVELRLDGDKRVKVFLSTREDIVADEND